MCIVIHFDKVGGYHALQIRADLFNMKLMVDIYHPFRLFGLQNLIISHDKNIISNGIILLEMRHRIV